MFSLPALAFELTPTAIHHGYEISEQEGVAYWDYKKSGAGLESGAEARGGGEEAR